MINVEVIHPDRLPRVLQQAGALPDDALLHLEAGCSHWFLLKGQDVQPPRRVQAAFAGEGIIRYSSPDETDQPVLVLGGTRASWRALLQRFPDEPRWLTVATEIGQLLDLPVQARGMTYLGGRPVYWGERTLLMGILNVTPDSFSDGGRYVELKAALARAESLLRDGADIIDVGGESTRSGADPVPAEEELRRVLPAVKAIVHDLGGVVSIDTNKAVVAEAAVKAGAAIINDITGLMGDPEMARVAADLGVPVVLMHMQGTPKNMQLDPRYVSVVPEVIQGLRRSIEKALTAGIKPENIIVDPGFGFGKNLGHNLELLRRLKDLRSLGYPVLTGTSRKTMVGEVLDLPVTERVEGTAATVALSVAGLADMVRVHDVRVMCRTIRMSDAVVRGMWEEGGA